jgi:hypothetical protein
VLIAGGLDASGEPLGTAVLFDEQSGTFGGEITIAPRAAHAAAPLGQGALLAGGVASGADALGPIPGFVQLPDGLTPLDTVQFVVPGSDALDKPVLPGGARAFPAAAALGDGSVLVAGGLGAGGSSAALDRYFDSDIPAALDDLDAAAFGAAAMTLGGNVLVAGGLGADGAGLASVTHVLSGDPPTVTGAPAMASGRGGFGLARLTQDTAVALAGLTEAGAEPSFAVRAERYDKSSGFTESGSLRQPRAHAAVVQLIDGAVLVIGGLTPDGSASTVPAESSVEVFRARVELP